MESHGKWRESWKSHGILTICFRKKILECKNKQDRWKILRMAKNASKMRYFQAKIFRGGGTAPSPDPTPAGEGNTPDQTAHPRYIFVHLLFLFFGHCMYKSSHGKALIWSGKVMEIDFSKVVGTMHIT